MKTNFTDDKYVLKEWHERDRDYVGLENETNDQTVFELWDTAVQEAIDDGFLNVKNERNKLESMIEMAYDQGLITRTTRIPKLRLIKGEKNPTGDFMKRNQMLMLVAAAAAAYWWFKLRKHPMALSAGGATPQAIAGIPYGMNGEPYGMGRRHY